LTRQKTKKVLVVVNSVRKAQEIYRELHDRIEDEGGDSAALRILHARYARRDRKLIEKDILAFAHKDRTAPNPGIWVCTQIVEASLDVDFDVIHTEQCTIDSLLQRMGRVYRHRTYTKEEPNVLIYMKKPSGRIDKDLMRYTRDALERIVGVSSVNGTLLREEDKQKMIDLVYHPGMNKKIMESDYYRTIAARLDTLENLHIYSLAKKEAQTKFREIFSYETMPISIYKELLNNGTLDKWKDDIAHYRRQDVIEAVKNYTVSVPDWTMETPGMLMKFPNASDFDQLFDNLWVCCGEYDFDSTTATGLGMDINSPPNTRTANIF
jgi:CRISPR-associated endonuclease/helicase Cas3